jgi:hypothetical protein
MTADFYLSAITDRKNLLLSAITDSKFMKKEKRTLHKQRQVLNKKLGRFFELKDLFVRPPSGG